MPANDDDWGSVLRAVGWLPTVLGVGLALLGSFYALSGWRYGGAVLIWSLMWGVMLAGLGTVMMATGRVWLVVLGVVACALSALLTLLWEREAILDTSWRVGIYGGDAMGVTAGLISIVARKMRRPAR